MSKRLKKSTNKPVSNATLSEANNDNTLNQNSLVNPNIGSSASHSASHSSSGNQNTNPAFGSNTPLSNQNTNMSSSNILNQPFLGYSFGNRDTQPSLYPTVPPFIITTNTSNNPVTSGSSVNNGNSSGNNPNTNSNNNPNSNNIFNLFRGGNNTSTNNTINEDSRREVRVNSSVVIDCFNMVQELVAFGFDKEVIESMNASELFFNYSDMYNQLDQVYNNESAFQKRIGILLNKYYYALDNLDDLSMFTSKLGVAINNSFEIMERQEMQELMVLLVALRKMSLKFGAKQNNMALRSELLNGYIKSDTLEIIFVIIQFLGLELNFIKGKIFIPMEKQMSIICLLENLIKASNFRQKVKIKSIATVLGKIEFLAITIPYLRAVSWRIRRDMIKCLEYSKGNYSANMFINKGALKDLKLLVQLIKSNEGCSFELETSLVAMDTDSSLTGFGGVTQDHIFIGEWSNSMNHLHINEKELRAILEIFIMADMEKVYLRGTNLLIRTNNMTALYYLRKGYRRIDSLTRIAREIWDVCHTNGWHIKKVNYIPSASNIIPDLISRKSEWSTSRNLFLMLNEKFGPFTVDRFASVNNHHIAKFNDWTFSRDAFKERWDLDINYIVPLLGLIVLTLVQIIKHKASSVLVIPEWTEAPWWPVVLKIALSFVRVAKQEVIMNTSTEIYKNLGWQLLAAQVNGHLYWKT
ncbi:hypothetical protein ABK040_006077 [Willaertia magna]